LYIPCDSIVFLSLCKFTPVAAHWLERLAAVSAASSPSPLLLALKELIEAPTLQNQINAVKKIGTNLLEF
jgi:hypothetical protein